MKVIVESAVKLDAKETKELESILGRKLPSTFTIENVLNPEILGGLRVTIGSKRIDLSLKGRLDQIKEQLA